MTLPRRIGAVIFDMDGVLFDTEKLYEEAAIAAAAELGVDMTSAFFRSTVGTPWIAIRARILEHYGQAFAVDDLRAVAARIFNGLVAAQLPLKPGVLELIDLLDELGLPRAIATGSPRDTAEQRLRTHNLTGRFHRIVGVGDYDRHKPDPEPFLKAAEGLAVPPELCLAIEDSHNGVRAAAAAGMMTIMVPDLLPATDEIEALCLRVVPDLHEVRKIIRAGCQAT